MNTPIVLIWVKALHIIFVVCWFAGIFYLPRLFVNHAMAHDESTRSTLRMMERKLYRFMTPLGWLAVFFGLWLLAARWDAYSAARWMYAKLLLVVVLVVYHLVCSYFVRLFSEEKNARSDIFYRWFNEIPVLVLFGAVILVTVKPF